MRKACARAWCVALVLGALLPGCSSPPKGLPLGTSAAGAVFLVHGIWPDGDWWWTRDLARELSQEGLEPIVVNYNCFVGGWLFGYGTSPPAGEIARFVADAEANHSRTTCQTPLRWSGVGYSAGTVVLTKAAESGVNFERLYFGGSPIPMWSGWLQDRLREGSVDRLINYYSPFDLLVWVSFGSGIYGYHGGGAAQRQVINRLHFRTHYTSIWTQRRAVRTVVHELATSARGEAHTCFRVPWYRRWFESAKDRLRD
jgi:hypothetical protein